MVNNFEMDVNMVCDKLNTIFKILKYRGHEELWGRNRRYNPILESFEPDSIDNNYLWDILIIDTYKADHLNSAYYVKEI